MLDILWSSPHAESFAVFVEYYLMKSQNEIWLNDFVKFLSAMCSFLSTEDQTFPDSKVHGANMGPTWVLLAPDGPHVGPWTLLSGLAIIGNLYTNILSSKCPLVKYLLT